MGLLLFVNTVRECYVCWVQDGAGLGLIRNSEWSLCSRLCVCGLSGGCWLVYWYNCLVCGMRVFCKRGVRK